MSRPRGGKRYFEAQGRSAKSKGLAISWGRVERLSWPEWARQAWARGWINQGPLYATITRAAASLAKEAP